MMWAPNLIRGDRILEMYRHSISRRADYWTFYHQIMFPKPCFKPLSKLAQHWDDLPRAINSVTKAPALAAGLKDRDTLAIGQRADIIQFERIENIGLIHQVWSQGKSVF
jgi:alpha-D-ribose 1-methylphosphonate 5-triphosphate diphosphatase